MLQDFSYGENCTPISFDSIATVISSLFGSTEDCLGEGPQRDRVDPGWQFQYVGSFGYWSRIQIGMWSFRREA